MNSTQNDLNSIGDKYGKIPQTLEEQKEYYLRLFQKWEKQKGSEEVRVQSPEFWELLQEVDFEAIINALYSDFFDVGYIRNRNPEISAYDTYISLANTDPDQSFTLISQIIFGIGDLLEILYTTLNKPIVIARNTLNNDVNFASEISRVASTGDIYLNSSNGILNIINQSSQKFGIYLDDSEFSSITLENFDRGYFSPETNAYLNQMEVEGKLTLINCTWSGLPVLREDFSTLDTGQKIWEKEIVLDEKTKPLKTLLHKHLAFFADFVELTEGKKVQIRITSQTNILLVELFSFNGATKELIDRKYYEYVNYTVNDENDTSKISFSDKIDLISRITNEGTIGFEKGLFVGEKSRIEEIQKDRVEWRELAKTLATKLPDFNTNTSKINLNLKIEQNQSNSQTSNNNNEIKINNKIKQITEDKSNNKELKEVLESILEIKDLLSQSNLSLSDKDEALEYVVEIVDNIENSDGIENQNAIKILKKATRGLLSISSQLSFGMLTNAAWEILKTYLLKNFGITF